MKKTILLSIFSLCLSAVILANSTVNLTVKGMHCGGCETKFKSAAQEIKGVTEVGSVSAANSAATITFDEKVISQEALVKSLAEKTGYTVSVGNGAAAAGKPTGCCQKGEGKPACKEGEKSEKCSKNKKDCKKNKSKCSKTAE